MSLKHRFTTSSVRLNVVASRYTSRWYKPEEAATIKSLIEVLTKLDVIYYYHLTEYRSMTSSPSGRTWQLELDMTETR